MPRKNSCKLLEVQSTKKKKILTYFKFWGNPKYLFEKTTAISKIYEKLIFLIVGTIDVS